MRRTEEDREVEGKREGEKEMGIEWRKGYKERWRGREEREGRGIEGELVKRKNTKRKWDRERGR